MVTGDSFAQSVYEGARRGEGQQGAHYAKVPQRLYIAYHEYMNAYWDLEDKGIPFPEKFGYMRRWPVALMPREVKVQPATTP